MAGQQGEPLPPPTDAAAPPADLSAATAPPPDAFIRFRLSAIDHVLTYEHSRYDVRRSPISKEPLRQVPVIRIWGATDRGQRVTALVHGVYPYVYIEYKGKLDPESVNEYIRRFGAALNRAMELSLPNKHGKGQPAQYVAFIVLCKGTNFYGYHVGHQAFLKVYLVNPRHKNRIAEVLRSGAVLRTQFDVFEAHVPYLLQFMLDANLYGCGWVEVSDCRFREEVPEHVDTPSDEYNPPSCDGPYAFRTYTTRTVPSSRMHPSVDAGGPSKISYEALELDLPFTAILNRRRLTPRSLHHDFIERLHPETVERGKLVRSLKEVWEDERQRRSARGEPGPADTADTAPRKWDTRDPLQPVWRREPEFREKVARKVEEDLRRWREKVGPRGRAQPDFATYVDDKERYVEGSKTGWMDAVRTTFEQVDAVSVERFEGDERDKYPFGVWAVKGIGLSISKRDEDAWIRAGTEEVDVGRLRASTAANTAARRTARRRPREAGAEEDDDDDEMDGDDVDSGEDGSDGGGGRMPPPATQAEALARLRRSGRGERIERRGRMASTQEGEWECEPDNREDDDEEDDFWGVDAGTDRAASRAPSEASFGDGDEDEDDEAASRRSSVHPASVSPVKRPSVSPAKRSLASPSKPTSAAYEYGAADERPEKRPRGVVNEVVQAMAEQGGAFGRQAASFVATAPQPVQRPTPSHARTARSPTYSRNPERLSPAVTPSRRMKQNPFASPNRAVSVRVAPPSSGASTSQHASEHEHADALFTFGAAPPDTVKLGTAPKQAAAPLKRHLSNLSTALPLEQYLKSSDESANARSPTPPVRARSAVTPSQALAEFEDLPDGAFDEFMPTPTVKEEVPSQLPAHLRSSARPFLRFDGMDVDDKPDNPASPPHSPRVFPPDSDIETDAEQDVKPLVAATIPPTKKHVMFQLARSESSSSNASGVTTPTPIASTAGSHRSATPLQTSQNTADSADSAVALPPPPRPKTDHPLSPRSFVFAEPPPTAAQLVSALQRADQSYVVYKDPFYSKPADVPKRKREYAGRAFRIKGSSIKFLAPFVHHDAVGARPTGEAGAPARRVRKVRTWEYAVRPPTRELMQDWLRENGGGEEKKPRFNPIKSQIEGPTQKTGSDKFTSIKGASQREKQHMAVLAMEVHVNTRGKLLPNPQHDAIEAIFYCLKSDNDEVDYNGRSENTHVGVIVVGEEDMYRRLGITDYYFEVVETERDLIEAFIDKLRDEWDPECVAGFEVHHGSWGYLLERAEAAFEWNLVPDLGRVKTFDTGKFGDKHSDRWGFSQSSVLNFTGRHVLPVWRILKADNKFQQNSFEHIAFHVVGVRTPHFSYKTLTEWYTSGDPSNMARVFAYWRNRVEMDIEMLDAAEVVEQSCEEARVFGVDFNSVRTRGSQFKVESVMFKLAKPESLLLLSPNRVQVGRQNAAECMPLIMEPKSAFYKGPLLVMDFQSLYPSVMIAYNYCYSTFLGRVSDFKGSNKFGVSEIDLPDGLLHLLKDEITISPNGMMFAKEHIRKSLLAKMVGELLDTRVMVKGSMKAVAADKALTKLLNARQLALKFLANVTYGYTSATFSGRMPAVEVADAIVQTGRESLERAMETIKATRKWGAEVVYGDTDSLFIYLPGKTKDEAFRIGNEMADVITQQNPRPIKLKFEKARFAVYLPCVLVAKKRYVGFKYEFLQQKEPDFDAKGIETIRRDGIPACQKMQEMCLKILFRTSDLSLVKEYCLRQWKKIQAGDVSPQDFTIAKKVKLGSYAEGRLPPPGAAVAARAMLDDPRAEPEYGERVPYVMFQAEPGQKQVHRAIAPNEFLADPRLRLDATHYIERMMIPPLERIFNLMGADVKAWYREMAKAKRVHRVADSRAGKAVMLEQHFVSDRCVACGGPGGDGGLCLDCLAHPTAVAYALATRKQALQHRQRALHDVCVSCSGNPRFEPIQCDSIDCPNLYVRARNSNELAKVTELASLNF
ncbi:DNA polymerase zeta [Rhodotorula kratochvilovae]